MALDILPFQNLKKYFLDNYITVPMLCMNFNNVAARINRGDDLKNWHNDKISPLLGKYFQYFFFLLDYMQTDLYSYLNGVAKLKWK